MGRTVWWIAVGVGIGCTEPEPELLPDVLTVDARFDGEPLEGAFVVVDDALGTRAEGSTGPDGLLDVRVDEANGPFAVTVDPLVQGVLLATIFTRLDGLVPDEPVQFPFVDPDAEPTGPPSVELTGTVTGRTPDHRLLMWTYGAGGGIGGGGDDVYEVDAPVGEPFPLVVLEVEETDRSAQSVTAPSTNWHRLDHPAITTDTTFDFGLTEPETPTRVSVSVEVPSVPNGVPDGGIMVRDGDLTQWCGWPEFRSIEGTQATFDIAYLPPEGSDALMTRLFVQDQGSAPNDVVALFRTGTPDTWVTPSTFLPLPQLQAPGGGRVSLDQPIQNPALPEEGRLAMNIRLDNDRTLWTVIGAAGQEEITLPPPPPT
ncbi:MAG: hypothetical protein AAF211_27360, partial [Myxococcota bacterium]